MKKSGICKTILSEQWPIIAASLAFTLSIFMQSALKKPIITIQKQDSVITLNTTFLKLMAVGHKRMISDLIWIQTLLESDLEHYKKHDMLSDDIYDKLFEMASSNRRVKKDDKKDDKNKHKFTKHHNIKKIPNKQTKKQRVA